MRYLDFIKQFDNFDKYVLFLLDLGYSVQEVAKLVGLSRQGVYDVIKRNKSMLAELDLEVKNEAT